ncbi:MAG TPA: hypothetical protein VH393_13270 [Ktedonobacterales bacterium]
MQPNRDATDLGEAEHTAIQRRAVAVFRECETMEAACTLKARIACFLSCLDATEECLEGPVKAQDDVLQDMSMHVGIFWARCFETAQFGLLLVVGGALALSASPPRLALFECDVI